MNNAEIVISTIRRLYAETKEPIPNWVIYSTLKSSHSSKGIRDILIALKRNGIIRFDIETGKIEPILNDYEISAINNPKSEIRIDDIKIKNCIQTFFDQHMKLPTPSEIAEQFTKDYGQANQESITRYVRKMYERGVLQRDSNDQYFYHGILKASKNLQKWGL
jgi:hypothetical protein